MAKNISIYKIRHITLYDKYAALGKAAEP
ncbi:uncharacterized protein G2W53_037789 [Senna tora]|uniref:Uncharacterized protein n=1 Tax=Senna tora TaxID=362788 RepID=A0A834SK00_9FABA|nr:uncharacterized protein G2W53_037789 [Senna tora]